MCGIAGFSRTEGELFNGNIIARSLLMEIEHRGKDATGAAWLDRRGMLSIAKRPMTASDFASKLAMDKRANTSLLHTRAWTQGPPSNSLNNHPISTGRIVGVHNGCVMNDDELFSMAPVPKIGGVDSEAIFALLNAEALITDLLEEVDASMAIAWIDREDPEKLHLARGSSSPLIVGQTFKGSMVFGSESHAINTAASEVGLDLVYEEAIPEGTYLVVKNGRIIEAADFTPSWYLTQWEKEQANARTSGGPIHVVSSNNTATPVHSPTEKRFIPAKHLVPGQRIEEETYKAMGQRLPKRMNSIDEWLEEVASRDLQPGEPEDIFEMAEDLGAFLTRGSEVNVYLNTKGDATYGQIWDLPTTFPEGRYTVRILLPTGHPAYVSLLLGNIEPAETKATTLAIPDENMATEVQVLLDEDSWDAQDTQDDEEEGAQ